MSTRSTTIRRWLAAILVVLIAASVIGWYAARDTLPDVIRIASATEGGLYHELAVKLAARLSERTGALVDVIPTAGSSENRRLLQEGRAELAILPSSDDKLEGEIPITPLYLEPTLLIARRGSDIHSALDLASRPVAVGLEESGMRKAAETLLEHYGVPLASTCRYVHFPELRANDELAAAIVTTGVLNQDLRNLLGSRRFELVPVEDAEAICLLHPAYVPTTVPRGLFAEGPPVPAVATPTVAATAYLAVGVHGGSALVSAALRALYESDLRTEIPVLMDSQEARQWSLRPLHPAARRYLDPYAGLGTIANLMESLSAVKELLFALAAAAWLAWSGWRRLESRERERELQRKKDHLDSFLNETVRVEKEQMETSDPERLRALRAEVTRIKLRALEELADEDLRGDQAFEIFLIQCSSLIRHLQSRIATIEAAARAKGSEARPSGGA